VAAARWVERDLLANRRESNVRVYAVWFNMYPGDERTKWSSEFFADSRVTQYWDEPRVAGRTFALQLPLILDRRAPNTMPPVDDVLWDAFFVYAPDASWGDAVPSPVMWGYPIMVTRDGLAATLDGMTK
jgi:hypothetical protein